ncbi:hypothetical protein DMUE_6019, partial [Dictyocoela muelleri]
MTRILWIKSSSGDYVPAVDGYIYNKNKSVNGNFYWSCSHKHCHMNLRYVNGCLIVSGNIHLHTDDQSLIYKFQLKELIQFEILGNRLTTATSAYNKCRRELAISYGSEMEIEREFPSFDSLKSTIYRYISKRRPPSFLNSISLSISEFLLPNGDNMLLYSDFSGEKMIILGSVEFIRLHSQDINLKLIMDGTFKCASSEFFQLYIIYADCDGQLFPMIYSFLESKTESTYMRMFSAITSSLSRYNIFLSPVNVQIDFEVAAFNAIKRKFPTSTVSGCLFHFGQCLWRKIVKLGLTY